MFSIRDSDCIKLSLQVCQGWNSTGTDWDLGVSIYSRVQSLVEGGQGESSTWTSKLGLTDTQTLRLLEYFKDCSFEPAIVQYQLDQKLLHQLFSVIQIPSAGCGGSSSTGWSTKEICIFLLACTGFVRTNSILDQILDAQLSYDQSYIFPIQVHPWPRPRYLNHFIEY